jgi:Ca2+-transporting ATPase
MTQAIALPELDPDLAGGLTTAEAARRLESEGYNELPTARRGGILSAAYELAREPMLLFLVAAGLIYLVLGDVREALVLLASAFVVIGITFYQERRTERALEALRDLSSPRALVIRDGVPVRIAGRDVVRGDVLVLSEGDRVPADAVLYRATNLSTDESLLTGESLPVHKEAWDRVSDVESLRPGGENSVWVYSGTLVIQGQGIAQVRRTGSHTELGLIGVALRSVAPEQTPLQAEIGRLVRLLAIEALGLCVIVVLAYGALRGNWLNGVLAGVTLAMSLIPEEFPVVLTVFLALGAWRIAQRHVLTRRLPAIETLGSTTVLCVDKTGTLTLNRMSVVRLYDGQETREVRAAAEEPLPPAFAELVRSSVLASHRRPFDPMEVALRDLGERTLGRESLIPDDWTLVREYPLTPELLATTRVWQLPDVREYLVAAKGAPEAMARLCGLDQQQWAQLSREIDALAEDGLRLLGVARARATTLPESQREFAFEFLGLVGLADPVRPSVPESVEQCSTAGIRVLMITGDYPGTARAIARQIGLAPSDDYLTGPELDAMSDEELRERIGSVSIFARVVPQQKLRLVSALKANDQIVAMTGDGVNDAPALKAAHIGVAMGGRGTDVAREAASLVLLDDDFSSIVWAVRLGRRIFDNLRKAMAYVFAVHVPIAGMALLPLFFNWPLVLFPVHIVFLELIIDPACSVAFEAEPEEANVMRRPPRDPHEHAFDRRTIVLSALQGASTLAIVAGIYVYGLWQRENADEARALAFTTLIVANLCLIYVNRSWTRTILGTLRIPNRALWAITAGALVVLGLVLYVPVLQELFRFAPLPPAELALAVGAGFFAILWFEALKLMHRFR